MKINNFTGGISRYVSPNLITSNEGVEVTNVDLLKGSLSPIKEDLLYEDDASWLNKPEFYYFEGDWVKSIAGTSFTTFANKLYFSTGSGPLQVTDNGSDIFDLGISAPTGELSVDSTILPVITISTNTTGTSDIPADTYEYRVVYYYGDSYSYEDISHECLGVNGVTISITDQDTSSQVYIYRLYSGKYKLLHNTSDTTATISYNDLVLDISGNTSLSYLNGYDSSYGRQYCYTYASSVYGYESAPLDLTEEKDISGNARISGFVPSANPIVDQYKLYRIGGDITNLTLVETYDDTSTEVIDSYSDLDIAENDFLTTQGTIKPPDDLNYLSIYNSTLFASIGSKLYFSELALPNNWSELNTLELQDQITGIGATQNGLLIFNRNRTYLLRGTDSSNFSLILLNGEQGCTDHSTIKYVNNMLVWLSLDGICSSIGSGVTILTEQRLGKLSLNTHGAVVYNSRYFLFHEAGTYLLDFRTGNMTISEVDSIYKGGHYSFFHDSLFLYSDNNSIVKFGEDVNNRSLSFRTGWLDEGSITNMKVYKKIYIFTRGNLILNTFVDGNDSLVDQVLAEGFNELLVPQSDTRGYFMELKFEGTGEVIQVEIIIEEERIPYNG